MNFIKQQLANDFLQNRKTKEYQDRVDYGHKTVEDFAGEYLYLYGDEALVHFKEECGELEKDFYEEIVSLLK